MNEQKKKRRIPVNTLSLFDYHHVADIIDTQRGKSVDIPQNIVYDLEPHLKDDLYTFEKFKLCKYFYEKKILAHRPRALSLFNLIFGYLPENNNDDSSLYSSIPPSTLYLLTACFFYQMFEDFPENKIFDPMEESFIESLQEEIKWFLKEEDIRNRVNEGIQQRLQRFISRAGLLIEAHQEKYGKPEKIGSSYIPNSSYNVIYNTLETQETWVSYNVEELDPVVWRRYRNRSIPIVSDISCESDIYQGWQSSVFSGTGVIPLTDTSFDVGDSEIIFYREINRQANLVDRFFNSVLRRTISNESYYQFKEGSIILPVTDTQGTFSFKGIYNPGRVYNRGDIVYSEQDANFYYCNTEFLLGEYPNDSFSWNLYSMGSEDRLNQLQYTRIIPIFKNTLYYPKRYKPKRGVWFAGNFTPPEGWSLNLPSEFGSFENTYVSYVNLEPNHVGYTIPRSLFEERN